MITRIFFSEENNYFVFEYLDFPRRNQLGVWSSKKCRYWQKFWIFHIFIRGKR